MRTSWYVHGAGPTNAVRSVVVSREVQAMLVPVAQPLERQLRSRCPPMKELVRLACSGDRVTRTEGYSDDRTCQNDDSGSRDPTPASPSG